MAALNSTTNASASRRGFLTQAAGGAVLALATIPPASAAAAPAGLPDPIYAAIEAHRAATAGISAIHEAQTILETELPEELRRSSISAWGEEIAETDDPRWIDCERAVLSAFYAQDDAAEELVNVSPTTLTGITALLRYVVEADTDNIGFPVDLVDDDGNQRSWHCFLAENLAAAIQNCT